MNYVPKKEDEILKIRVLDNFEVQELSIDTHGMNFLCIFGEHINGGFISVLNFNISAEISFNSVSYSCDALASALYKSGMSDLIGDRSVCDEVVRDIITAVFKCLDSDDALPF